VGAAGGDAETGEADRPFGPAPAGVEGGWAAQAVVSDASANAARLSASRFV
jgi:hypothetical protein